MTQCSADLHELVQVGTSWCKDAETAMFGTIRGYTSSIRLTGVLGKILTVSEKSKT